MVALQLRGLMLVLIYRLFLGALGRVSLSEFFRYGGTALGLLQFLIEFLLRPYFLPETFIEELAGEELPSSGSFILVLLQNFIGNTVILERRVLLHNFLDSLGTHGLLPISFLQSARLKLLLKLSSPAGQRIVPLVLVLLEGVKDAVIEFENLLGVLPEFVDVGFVGAQIQIVGGL
jgi:hypothetical protein